MIAMTMTMRETGELDLGLYHSSDGTSIVPERLGYNIIVRSQTVFLVVSTDTSSQLLMTGLEELQATVQQAASPYHKIIS